MNLCLMIGKKLKIQSKIVIDTKRVYQTISVEGEKITPRAVPVATGRAFKERERKQELNKKPCLIQLRALIAREKAKHQAKVDEYNALRAQGFRRDPVRDSNLVSVLEVNEEDENILIEQNAVKSTQMGLSFLHIKTRHSFHLVDSSPWPILASLGVFILTVGSVLYVQKFIGGGLLVITGLALILFVMFTRWRDIIREATFVVQRGLRLGMVLFIVSEIMFFFAFFWAFFHSSLSSTFNIDDVLLEDSSMFNKHFAFLLMITVLFVVWLFVCAVYFFVGLRNRKNSKSVHSKKLEVIWPWLLALVFFSPWIIMGEAWDISVAYLEEEKFPFLEEEVVQSMEQAKCTENPFLCNNPESLNKAVFVELDNLFWSLRSYPVRRILTVLYAVPDSFWSLEFLEKRGIVLEALKLEDDNKVRREGHRVRAIQIVFVVCLVMFLRSSGGG